MSAQPMVCKHCGGDDFFVNVTVSGWQNLSAVTVGANGKLRYSTRGPVETDGYDGDIDTFVCNGGWLLCTGLSSPWSPREWSQRPHGAMACSPFSGFDTARSLSRPASARQLGYTRRAMPCEHEGCDCHDYYDREFAEAAA